MIKLTMPKKQTQNKIKELITKIKDCFGVKCCECGKRTWWARSCWTNREGKEGYLCIKCLGKSMTNDDKNDISFSEKADRDIEKELQDNQLDKV